MSKFPLDLSKFKKSSQDKDKAVLEHPDGHSMHIAMSGLTPRLRKQIESLPCSNKMADGGEVADKKEATPSSYEQTYEQTTDDSKKDRKIASQPPKKMAEGGDPEPKPTPSPTPQPIDKIKSFQDSVKGAFGMADGGQVPPIPPEEDAIQSYNPIDSLKDAAQFAAQKLTNSMQADTDSFNQAREAQAQGDSAPMEAFINKHAMNMATGTLMGPRMNFQQGAALQKAEQMAAQKAAGTYKPTAMEVNAMDQGLQSGPDYASKMTAKGSTLAQQPPVMKAKGGEVNPKLEQSKKVPPKMMAEGGDPASKADELQTALQQLQSPNVSSTPPVNDIVPATAAEMGEVEGAPMGAAASPSPVALLSSPSTQQPASLAPDANEPSAQQPQQDQVPSLLHGYNQEQQGIQGEAQALGQLGTNEAKDLDMAANRAQAQQQTFKNHYDALENERLMHQEDIQKGFIDPEKYWENHSKLAAGLGIILAGFNPAGNGNAAMDFINHQIDRSLHAQAQNLGAKQNLLGATMQQFGNVRDAASMSRGLMQDYVANKIQADAAKMQDPLAQARAQKLAGQLESQRVPEFMNLAMRRSLIEAQQQAQGGESSQVEAMLPYLRVQNPDMAKELEGRLVPGIGLAKIPVSADVRSNIIAKQQLGNRAQDFYDWAKQHSGSVDPALVAQGATKAAELQSLYRNAINGGVFKKGEQEFIDQIVDSDPTKFFNKIRVLPKIKEVVDSNARQLNTLKQGYGLPTHTQQPQAAQLTPQQQSFKRWANQNPNHPYAKTVNKALGNQ